jgi:predicted dehydrogenase
MAGGGSLMDLGIYPLNGMRLFTGENPSTFTAQVATRDHSGKFNGIEETVHWTMEFPSGILASASSSYGANGPNFLNICGDKGYISFTQAFGYDSLHVTGRTTNGPLEITDDRKMPYQFQLEAEHFAQSIRTGHPNQTPGEEGLTDLLAIEAIYKSAGTPIA